MAEIVVRTLEAADAAVYRECRLAQLDAVPDAFGESTEESARVPLEAIAAKLGGSSDEGCVIGAFDGGALVGTAGWFRLRETKTRHKGKVWGVYVAAPYRGRGIGRRMVRALVDASATAGIEQLTLSVSANQTAARRLYEAMGFEKIGCEPRALKIGERYVDEELMLLRLSSS